MRALSQTSKTSAKNWRMASSVWGLVGLLAMEELPLLAEDADAVEYGRSDDGGVDV